MKNKQKNKAAKQNSKPTGASQSLKKVGKSIARFATTKKAVGVLALATLGLSYLAKRRKAKETGAGPHEAAEAA